MKTILFFTPTLSLGGVEKVLTTYANGLTHRFIVKFAFSDFVENTLLSGLSDDVERISLGKRRARSLLFPLVRVLNKLNPDYLITGGDVSNAIAIIAGYISFSKVKVIVSQHNFIDVESKRYSPKTIIKLFYNKAYRVVAVSNGIKDFLIDSGVDRSKIIVFYNPIDLDHVGKLCNERTDYDLSFNYLVSVGRLDKVKNLSLMIKSFAVLRHSLHNIKLMIIGDGSEKDALQHLCRELSLDKDVIFTGCVTNPYPYIDKAKLVLSTSFSEAMPTIFIEAFSLGKTMVSTPTRGAQELLEGRSIGYMSKQFDSVSEFASIVEFALKNPCDVMTIKEYAKNFSSINQVRMLEALLV